MYLPRHVLAVSALFGLVAFVPPANAAIEWTFTGGQNYGVVPSANACSPSPTATVNLNTYGNCGEWAASSGPTGSPAVQATAWSNTDTNGGLLTGDSRKIDDAYLAVWSGGLGVVNKAEATGSYGSTPTVGQPNHAMDNAGQYDSILLSFDSKVVLSGVSIGWPDSTTYDTDITVLAYTGSATTAQTPDNLTYAQLVTNGWTLVGHYSNADIAPQSSDPALPINSQGVSSKYWIVAAYNTLVGGSTSSVTGCPATSGGTSCTKNDDYMKILGVTASTPGGKVPEPSSAMLLLAVIGAGGWVARRKSPTAGRKFSIR